MCFRGVPRPPLLGQESPLYHLGSPGCPWRDLSLFLLSSLRGDRDLMIMCILLVF